VVPERHENVAAVAADEDVFQFGEIAQPVDRQVGFNEPAVCLRIQRLEHLVQRRCAKIEPGRHLPDRCREGLLRE
jgi:hypothetical protein